MKKEALITKEDTSSTEDWTRIITAGRGWLDMRPGDLWEYRDLIVLFVRRDFTAYYKQTVLGPLWFLIQPLLTTMVFAVVFGRIARVPTDRLPPSLFYMAGVVIWN